MASLIKLLQWITNNWASLVTIIVLVTGIAVRARKLIEDWNKKTAEEKEIAEQEAFNRAVAYARNALADYILILVSQAEIDWQSTEGKLGKTKRAQVIKDIYDKYPVLEQVADKEELLGYIDELINKALNIVREELRQDISETAEEK